jgi:type IX secretion system PorP/SprF family membrane protein
LIYTKIRFSVLLLFIFSFSYSQEGIPIYSDYLSDNYYLIHPSMAGASDCTKLRITSRSQWSGQDDAPSLQTLSLSSRIGDRTGAGIILFNDKNGYHSQKGIKLTYAYHILFSRDEMDLNQLSFGMNAGVIQSQLDETSFIGFDPIVNGGVLKDSYFNVDFGASYNYLNFYTHATVQGALETRRQLYTEYESKNIRKYLLSAGYTFGSKKRIWIEPSFLFQLVDKTKEKIIDINLKAYKKIGEGNIWAALSYRRNFNGTEYYDGIDVSKQNLQYVTPILGAKYKNFMFAYTYSKVIGDIQFDSGAYHQVTLGINLFCKKERYECECPAINL